jgi:protein O-GlcNAc transferase
MGQKPRVGSQQLFHQALQLRGAGRLAEAKKLLLGAVNAPGASTEELQLLGVICGDLGQEEEAVRHLRRALQLTPKSASAHFNLGTVLLKGARYEDALASLTDALALKPNTGAFLAAIGDTLAKLGRSDEAIERYRQAIAAAPDDPHAHENLGRTLYRLDRTKEAIKSLQQAIRLAPGNNEAIFILAKSLFSLEIMPPAIEAFGDVLKHVPAHAGALAGLIHGKQYLCLWSDYRQQRDKLIEHVRQGKVATNSFVLLLIADNPELHLICASRAVRYERASEPVSFNYAARAGRKLKLAYVSADYRAHATSVLMGSLFAHHDRQTFEIYGISLGEDDGSAIRKRVLSGFDHVIEARGKSPEEICAELRALEIDIVVDLMGHTKESRREIFQLRAAPIQVNYLGYPGTSGADYMDYIVLDPFIATERVRSSLSEKPVILPDCYQVNDRERVFPDHRPTRTEYGLPESGFVFCAFNGLQKITPEIFDIWMRILKQVDESVLWLIGDNPTIIANLRREAAARDVSPERLIFGEFLEPERHLPRYRIADLFLDTLPYGAHTTSSDALWMGCPVLTCAGESFAARVAGSLLHTIGVPELVTGDLREYEALAVELAGDAARLAGLRTRLAELRLSTPLFDTARFARNIEKAYVEMWRLHEAGEAPRDNIVPAP